MHSSRDQKVNQYFVIDIVSEYETSYDGIHLSALFDNYVKFLLIYVIIDKIHGLYREIQFDHHINQIDQIVNEKY